MLLLVRVVSGSFTGPVKSDSVSSTARHRCNVSWELCFPDTLNLFHVALEDENFILNDI